MREHPVFVPGGDDHLSAVVTVPDGAPRALVLLVPGTAPRSHRFKVWTRAARRLAAELDVASIRVDHRGFGDSTGALGEWEMGAPPLEHSLAAVRFATRAVAADRLLAVGNCGGARIALGLVPRVPELSGVMCVLPHVTEHSAVSNAVQRAAGSRLAQFVPRNELIRRTVVRPLLRRQRRGSGADGLFKRALRQGPLAILYSEEDYAFNHVARTQLEDLEQSLDEGDRVRFEMRFLRGAGLEGFESLEVQETLIDAIVDWVGRCLAAGGRDVVPAGAPVGTVPLQ